MDWDKIIYTRSLLHLPLCAGKTYTYKQLKTALKIPLDLALLDGVDEVHQSIK